MEVFRDVGQHVTAIRYREVHRNSTFHNSSNFRMPRIRLTYLHEMLCQGMIAVIISQLPILDSFFFNSYQRKSK